MTVPGQQARAAGGGLVSGAREPGKGGPSEYKLKAAFIYNFVRFTTWPEKSLGKKNKPVEVLIVGKDRFGGHLDATFKGKELHGRKVVIKHVTKLPKSITAQLVYACALSSKDNAALIKLCKGKPILLMGEEKGFAVDGACANFYLDGKRLRFQVNTVAVKAAGLTISSQLLKLAEIVKSKEVRK